MVDRSGSTGWAIASHSRVRTCSSTECGASAAVNRRRPGRGDGPASAAAPDQHGQPARQRDRRGRAPARLPRSRRVPLRAPRTGVAPGEPRCTPIGRGRPVSAPHRAHRHRDRRPRRVVARPVVGRAARRGGLGARGARHEGAHGRGRRRDRDPRAGGIPPGGRPRLRGGRRRGGGERLRLSWLCEKHPESIRTDFCVNEGGGDRIVVGSGRSGLVSSTCAPPRRR